MRLSLVPLALLLSAPVLAQDLPGPDQGPPPPQGFVTITGEGTAGILPDVATVRLTVATEGASPRQAFEANAARVAAVVEKAGMAGVPQSQIRSDRFQVGPTGPNGAYQVRHTLVARVRGLARLGEFLERTSQAGASDISGPEFSADETGPALRDARLRAAKDADERARAYAQSLGLKLGRIVAVNEAEPPREGPPPAAAQPEAHAIEIGQTDVRAKVTVVWEIAPSAAPERR